MKGIACPHCTYLNPPNKVKCGMCLRLLRKRERTELAARALEAKKGTGSATGVPSHGTTSSPAPLPQKAEIGPSHSAKGTANQDDTESHGVTATIAPEEQQQPEEQSPQHSAEATLGCSVSPADPAPPPTPPPSSTSAVPTLFVTASGKAVTVRRESLQKAAERFESTSFTSPPSSESQMATVLETASDEKAAVQRDPIEKARRSFAKGDEADAEPHRTVLTLFETAAGATVRVAESSLRRARERLEGEESETAEDRAASVNALEGATATAVDAKAPSENADRRPIVAPRNAMPNFHPPSSLLAGFSVGRRRGFVPPQQRFVPDAAARPRVVATPSSLSTAARAQSTRLEPLRLTSQLCSSPAMSRVPSLTTLMSEEFCFTAEECGVTLARLLGIPEKQSARVPQWHTGMLKLGASPKHCTGEWCRHALLSAMFRMTCASRAKSVSPSVFSAMSVLLCLLQAYNTEMVNGERPPLRKMVEGDIPSASLVVLYLSSIREERSAPHMRIVTLSDGIYHLKVTCDVPLSNLVREGILRPGQKLAVCGAKLLLHSQCSPTDCDTQVVLAINYNCVRAVSPQVPLGVCHGEPPPLPLSLVHPLGGLVPAIEGVVARVLPSFYMTQEKESVGPAEDGSRPARDRAIRAVRNSHAQLHVSDRLHREMEGAERAVDSKQLSRVTSLLIVKDGTEALVQQWEVVEERSLLIEEDGGLSLPTEGSWVTMYAVNPAKSRTAAAPFSHAKLFFSARKLHFVPSRRPLQHLRQVWETTVEKSKTVCVGDVTDVCGLFMGQHKNEEGCFVLVLLQDSVYAVLQTPVPSASRVLSFPVPTSVRTPLLILNATFLTTEDSIAGSDCCRLFANEYTAVLQRSTQINLKEALARAASLRSAVEAAPQKYAARKAEIFRCLDGGETAGNGSVASYAQRISYCMTDTPLDRVVDETIGAPPTIAGSISSTVSSSFPCAASLPLKEGRLPYYLRQGGKGGGRTGINGDRRLQGVFIPSAPHTEAAAKARSVMPSEASHTTPAHVATDSGESSSSRHYGNVSDFMFVYDPKLNRRAWHPLGDPLPVNLAPSPPLHHHHNAQQGDDFKYVQLCWSVSANSGDDLTSRVEDKRHLSDLMEAVCPLKELCALIADERNIDVSLQRSERVAQWRKEGRDTVWWRFFVESRLLSSASELDCGSGNFLWWLPHEWEATMKTVSAKLRNSFFFFSIRSGALRHTRLISDSCDVRELPSD
ncbi:putative BRCA2 repeat-containing protein [Leptomonas seymouri]|uniref:Putative BRCA2 repeat-containing protein n=1 Tax=Leptomonas seymouri TaxID=5684 RepID=A0A0N1PAP2_LEPSE|nr:putative BRCA2 repeat-containing protein [Leptomonas seymouri]|eukprot:KPI85633.1 putative BRCA2 repeat-containing protein [Leptomonas seymouri]